MVAGNILRKTGLVLLTILKGLLQAVLLLLKLALGAFKVFLLLFALAARVVLSFVGISAGR